MIWECVVGTVAGEEYTLEELVEQFAEKSQYDDIYWQRERLEKYEKDIDEMALIINEPVHEMVKILLPIVGALNRHVLDNILTKLQFSTKQPC
jgi:hypothetical protein